MGKSGKSPGGGRAPPTEKTTSPWPSDVTYLTSLHYGDDVKRAKQIYAKYRVSGDDPILASAASTKKIARWQRIVDANHPARGEHGLFASRKLERGERIVDYLGHVSLRGNESQTSDYTASFGDAHELALDAEKMGNEARMINDFRNTGKRANALFDQYVDAAGDTKLGVFVGPHAIGKGEEILVSYGKGFWRNRVGDMSAFTGHDE